MSTQSAAVLPQLVLNTWFMMYLHDRTPGGLPNDFLTVGSPAMLVFDEILVDRFALESEKAFLNQWVSSWIFAELEKRQIIRAVDLRRLVPQEAWSQQDAARVLTRMEEEREAIKQGKIPTGLIPEVTELNAALFAHVGVGEAHRVLYDWHEHHFRSTTSEPSPSPPNIRAAMQTLSLLAPNFHILPPLSRRARNLLSQNINREKNYLYRWIYGDPSVPQERYQDFRRRAVFRDIDAQVDRGRQGLAHRNIDKLEKLREQTRDVRNAVQMTLARVLTGKAGVATVARELELQRLALNEFVPTLGTVKTAITRAKADVIMSVFPGFEPAQGVISTQSLGAAYRLHENIKRSRRQYPLAWFHHEVSTDTRSTS